MIPASEGGRAALSLTERTKAFIRSALPGGVRIYRGVRGLGRRAWRARPPGMEAVFSEIYRRNLWGDAESVSGRGSTLARTRVIREVLPGLLEDLGARTLLDAPCGDFNWMRHVRLAGVSYVGADVVPEIVARNRREHGGPGREFVALDITSDPLPRADVILCRDCLIHLPFRQARSAVENFKRSGSRFLLATTHTLVRGNADAPLGGWRSLNLELPPFAFPRPLRLVTEDEEAGKCLGLWRLEDL